MSHAKPEMQQQLEAASSVLDVPMDVKEITQRWILLTYDVPTTADGIRARAEFLSRARSIGAVQHTESVYLMPWTHGANISTVKLSSAGAKVYVFTAETDFEMARELSQHYDAKVMEWIEEIDDRIDRIAAHISDRRYKIAGRMTEHTFKMLEDMEGVVQRRGSRVLSDALQQTRMALREVVTLAS